MKSINTALCSFGMSGHLFHGPFIDVHPNFNLYGVLERTKNLAQEKYPNIKTFRSLENLLQDNAIDLVVVNTPNITHYNYTKKIIEAGKHVVVEKPFTVTTAEAQELIDLAKKHNVKLSVYHNRRWDSDFKTVKKIIDEGVLGDIVEAEFHYDRFDPELSYKTHKETPTEGVGSLYDLGSHLIDQALQLFGMPNSVFASLDSFRKDSKVGDYFDVKLYYTSHYVTLKSSYFVREPLPAYSIHGTKGSFIKSKADIQETELQKEIKPNTNNWGIEPESEKGILHILKNGDFNKAFVNTEQGDYMAYYNGIYNAIANNKPLPVTAQQATDVIKIIEVAIQSNQEKRIIEL
ncbi:Gfo/Idh/MocA family oxidoreductase [Winogradskyella litoriviva]|uniref:Gfo/Idh/MocA family oxidoreductase n=1 Tax=Winogradskyella litoriviva TaxID=1220182 RepID=A0ABX2E0S5_9FLAO|nr:Gfo/Idh/MocA family oxidoreductase [Winogradskyella litoriviva]NRD21819.1 Gfo/Idh/MocA family oxidoreductase [Winogradskyella litoriviva]